MTRWRWPLWWLVVGLWALALLTPQPAEVNEAVFGDEGSFATAKLLHGAVYAGLTAAAAWLPAWRRRRWLPVLILALHGCGTEVLQTLVPHRTGCVRDALIDLGGIACGLALTWPWWRRPVR